MSERTVRTGRRGECEMWKASSPRSSCRRRAGQATTQAMESMSTPRNSMRWVAGTVLLAATANPNWSRVARAMSVMLAQSARDRPTIRMSSQ